MASNIKNFKCLIHFNETQRGSILSEDLTYSMLHEMVMQKFNLEANAVINLSFKLSSFDFAVDITNDTEDFEQSPVMEFTDNEISNDSNIIPYSQYLQETQQATVQDTNLQA
ncbi:hypothetical protein Tco_0536227 [Tanacetum coccineum]